MEELLERERELAAVQELLERGGSVLVVEGGAGIGKTALLDAASDLAAGLGYETLAARGSELEVDFAFGVVRQLFERRLAVADADAREALLAGAAGAVRPLLLGEPVERSAFDTSFAVLHGLYWLTVNLADRRPLADRRRRCPLGGWSVAALAGSPRAACGGPRARAARGAAP